MKAFIIFLSLVFMGCVTANTRDLSAINPKTEPANQSEATSEPPLLLADDYSDCMDRCTSEHGGSSEGCDRVCENKDYSNKNVNKKPLKVAGYDECVQGCVAEGYCGPSGKNCEDTCRSACK